MTEKIDDLLLLQVVVARLRGKSWNSIAEDMIDETGQKLRRHVKIALFPTRKRKILDQYRV